MKEVSEKDVDLFVVVCTDLHLARGPIVGLDLAAEIARYMNVTGAGACTHVPVPFLSLQSMMGGGPLKAYERNTEAPRGGMYL